MSGEPFERDGEADEARLRYLMGGDSTDLDPTDLDSFDQAELDVLLATLADPTTWDAPSADLGDRVVQQIADEAAATRIARPPVETPAPTTAPAATPRQVVADLGERRRRRTAWIGPALVAAAAAAVIAVVATVAVTDDGGGEQIAIDATIDLAGTDLAPGLAGTAEVDARQSGLWISLDLPGLPRRDGGDFYEAWLRSEDGSGLIPIGTFHDASEVILWAGVAIEDFPIITITRETVAGPDAPEQGSSGEVVARGQLQP